MPGQPILIFRQPDCRHYAIFSPGRYFATLSSFFAISCQR
jgi:hypothetical protein